MAGSSLKWFLGASFCVILAASCGGATETTKGSESHFLANCDDAPCADGLSCICGVCTRVCQEQPECDRLAAAARCVELGDLPASARCGDVSEAQGVCDAPCTANSECRELGQEFTCNAGICRVPGPEPEPGTAGRGGSGGTGGIGGAGVGGATEPGPRCEQPREVGTCDAAIPRYWHNPATRRCEQFIYGGCEGNENNFESLEACQAACSPLPDLCSLPLQPGPCRANGSAYGYNPATGACQRFPYGGCQGNANRFETRAACEQTCAPTPTELNRCTTSAECRTIPTSCCEVCQDATADDYVAVNTSHVGNSVPGSPLDCSLVDCVACDEQTPNTNRGSFGARCEAGRCVVFDVRETSAVECSTKEPGAEGSCIPRAGLGCCERCDVSTGLTAVSIDVDIAAELGCGDIACPPCVPSYPDTPSATCNLETARCELIWTDTSP